MRKAWLLMLGGLGLGVRGSGFPSPEARAPSLQIDVVPHEDQRRVDVLVDGKPFTAYIYPTTVKKPVLYPLRAASGTVITRGWPLEPRRSRGRLGVGHARSLDDAVRRRFRRARDGGHPGPSEERRLPHILACARLWSVRREPPGAEGLQQRDRAAEL